MSRQGKWEYLNVIYPRYRSPSRAPKQKPWNLDFGHAERGRLPRPVSLSVGPPKRRRDAAKAPALSYAFSGNAPRDRSQVSSPPGASGQGLRAHHGPERGVGHPSPENGLMVNQLLGSRGRVARLGPLCSIRSQNPIQVSPTSPTHTSEARYTQVSPDMR